jgi:hypothetical protein
MRVQMQSLVEKKKKYAKHITRVFAAKREMVYVWNEHACNGSGTKLMK